MYTATFSGNTVSVINMESGMPTMYIDLDDKIVSAVVQGDRMTVITQNGGGAIYDVNTGHAIQYL